VPFEVDLLCGRALLPVFFVPLERAEPRFEPRFVLRVLLLVFFVPLERAEPRFEPRLVCRVPLLRPRPGPLSPPAPAAGWLLAPLPAAS
jgi:hypothetical protein